MSHIEDAMRKWMGKRCPEFEPGCACCQGWVEVDEIDRLRAELAEMAEQYRMLEPDHAVEVRAIARVLRILNLLDGDDE